MKSKEEQNFNNAWFEPRITTSNTEKVDGKYRCVYFLEYYDIQKKKPGNMYIKTGYESVIEKIADLLIERMNFLKKFGYSSGITTREEWLQLARQVAMTR